MSGNDGSGSEGATALAAAVPAAENMPGPRRRAAQSSISEQLDGIEAVRTREEAARDFDEGAGPAGDAVQIVLVEVFLGREKIVKGGDSATVGLLLSELTNPPDPFHQGKQELGFTSERFAPMEELPPEEAVASEGELVGAGAEKHQGGYWSN
jgi:hypothetical protein